MANRDVFLRDAKMMKVQLSVTGNRMIKYFAALLNRLNQRVQMLVEPEKIARSALASTNLAEAIQWRSRYEAAGRASNQVLYDYDIHTNTSTWMGDAVRILGYSAAELGSQSVELWLSLIHPDDRPQFQTAVERVQTEKQPIQMLEYRLRRKDGSYIWVQDNNEILLNEAGNPDRVIGFVANITQRKQAEAEQQQLLKRLSELEFALDQATITETIDAQGKIIHVNDRFCEISQYSREELLGKTHKLINSGDYPESFFQDVWQTISSGQVWKGGIKNCTKDGSEYWVDQVILPFFDDRGQPVQYMAIGFEVTERKQAEAALRQSEEQNRAILSAIPDIMALINADGIYQSLSPNRFIGEILPIEGMDFAGRHLADVLPPDDVAAHLHAIQVALSTGKLYIYEQQFQFDDRTQYEEVRIVPYQQDSVLYMVRNISDRKQAELALRESQQFIQQIADSSPNVIYIYDLVQQRNVYVNREVVAFLGYTSDEIMAQVDQSIANLMHPNDVDRAMQHFGQFATLPDGTIVEFEYRMQHKNGEWRWFSSRDTVFKRDANGRVSQILGNAQDITARKQAEQKLQDSQAFLNSIINAIADPIFVKDEQHRWVLGNSAFCDLVGVPNEELIGKIDNDFFPPEQAKLAWDNDQQVLASGVENFNEEPAIHATKGLRIVATKKTCFQDSAGNKFLVGYSRDITEQKQVEAEIRQNQQQLAAIAANVPGGVFRFIYHADGRHSCPFVSEGYRTLLGIDPEQFKANPDMNLAMVHPDDLPIYTEAAAAAIAQQANAFRGEVRYILPTGEVKWIATSAQLYREANGDVIVDGIDIDITYRKQIELEISQNRDLREAIFNESADALFLVDPQTLLILDCNNCAVDMFEVANKEALINIKGHTLQRHQSTPEELTQITDEMNASGFWSQEIEYVTLQGKIFWGNIAAKRITVAGRNLNLVRVTDIDDRKQTELSLQRTNQLLSAISEAQTQFITKADPGVLFENLLETLLQLTSSEYGFIGEILYNADGQPYVDESYMKIQGKPYLKTKAITDITWNEETRKLYNENAARGMEFHNLKTLFGQVMVTGQPIISNHPSTDPRRGGLPAGHPPLNAFLGVPFYRGEQLVGMVGLANRPSGYDETVIAELKSFLTTCASTIEAYRTEVQRKQAELALQELNAELEQRVLQRTQELQKLAAVVENSTDLISIASLSGESLYLNAAGQQFTGLTDPASLIGMPVEAFLSPAGLIQFQQVAMPVLMQQGYWCGETIFRHLQTGEDMITEQTLFLITDPQTNEPLCMATISRDIRDRKQAELALQEAQQFAQSIADKTPAALYIYNLIDHCNLYSNRSIIDLLGYSTAEIQAMGTALLPTLLHPEDSEKVAQHHQALAVAVDGEDLELEYRMRHANGEWHWFYSRDSVFKRDETGQVTQYIGAAQEITERKQLEQKLRQMNAELERRVEARTIDLQHAMEAAEAANRAKSTFLANMSHELRTPLNAILGFAQLMARDRTLEPKKRQQLNIINRSGQHLLNLINDILEMSKIEAGRLSFSPTCFDLYLLLNTIEEMFHLRAIEKGLQLIIDRAATVPQYIETDENKLRQVLINLLGNAIKFTASGQVILRISSQEFAQTSPPPHPSATSHALLLSFVVEDTGTGIDPTELDSLFEPFIQSSNRQAQEGTGLGLPISRQFVQLMGGDLTVDSTLEVGSSFTFSIPVHRADAINLSAPSLPRPILGLADQQPHYRILVVEDNETNRQLLVQLLQSVGFEVLSAANGQEAIALWETWHPHLIWMDMRMPILDGYAATKQIRSREQESRSADGLPLRSEEEPLLTDGSTLRPAHSPTIIIALTASAFEEERAKVLGVGCNDFVRKPFQEADLLEKIADYLGVQYRYAEAEPEHKKLAVSTSFDAIAALQTLSTKQLTQLHQATIQLDSAQLKTLVEQITPDQPMLVALLMEKLENFDLKQILDLLQAAMQIDG